MRNSVYENSRVEDIFRNISKLTDEALLEILGRCCIGLRFYKCVCGVLKSYQSRPCWNCSTLVTEIVEPDIFLRFTDTDFIVSENRSEQERSSIEQDLLAYEEIYGQENKTVIKIVFGGEDLPFEVFLDDHPSLNALIFYCSENKLGRVVEDMIQSREIDSCRDNLILDEISRLLITE